MSPPRDQSSDRSPTTQPVSTPACFLHNPSLLIALQFSGILSKNARYRVTKHIHINIHLTGTATSSCPELLPQEALAALMVAVCPAATLGHHLPAKDTAAVLGMVPLKGMALPRDTATLAVSDHQTPLDMARSRLRRREADDECSSRSKRSRTSRYKLD